MTDQTNEFDAAAASVMQGQTATLRNNIYNAVTQNPAQVAQNVQLASSLGVPVESVQSDPATAKQQAAMQAFDANKVVTQYPHLAQFLADPTNAAMAHTDLPTLAATEQAVKGLPQPAPAVRRPQYEQQSFVALPDQAPTIRDRLTNIWASIVGGPTADQQRQAASAAEAVAILAGRNGNPGLVPPPNATPAQIQALNDQAFEASRQAVGGMSQAPQVMAENAVKAATFGIVQPNTPTASHSWQESVAGGVGQLVGFIAGPVKAAQALFGLVPKTSAAAVSAGDAWATALLKETAAQAATLGTATALQEAGGAALDSHSAAEAGGKVAHGAATGAATGAMFGVAGRVLPDSTIPQWAGRFLGVSAAQDALTGQSINDDRSWQQKVFDYGQNAFFTMHGAGRANGNWFINSPKVAEKMAEADSAQQAVQGMQGLQALGELAGSSELRKNNPQAFHDFVQQVTEDGHLPEVWVDGRTLADALHQSGITPEELQTKLPDVAKQMNEALQTQGDVRISTADFATHIAGGPLEQPLLPHLKTDPDGMTFQQGQEHLAAQQQDMQAQAKEIIQDQEAKDERASQVQAIREELQQRIEATGRFPADIAKQYAALHAAFYDTAAERMGITPAEAAARYPLPDITARAGAGEHLDQGAYHGSPHQVDKFSTAHMGTGEGAQVYGWGMYFAKRKDVAKFYTPRDISLEEKMQKEYSAAERRGDYEAMEVWERALMHEDHEDIREHFADPDNGYDESMQKTAEKVAKQVERILAKSKGSHLYKVDIPEDKDLLNWDAPLTEQPDNVKAAIEGLLKDPALKPAADAAEAKGENLYEALAEALGSDKAASEHLRTLGVKGIKYLDNGSRAGGDGSHNFVIFHDDDVAIANQLYQGARGAFDPASNTIALLKDADLSTFLHESGHFFLEKMHEMAMRPEAPEGIKGDFDTLLQHFKVEGATPEERMAAWTGRDLAGKRDGHEQFAEAFEKYLLDGKAPVPELQSLFGRFRAWLMSVYQSLRGDVSPEVRGVMDRMFASQEAIAQAERVRAYAIPDLPGEHGPMIDEYKALGHEATEQAIADMQARSMRDLKWASNAKAKAIKELQRTAKEERAKITDEVTKEVMKEPVYRAETFLRTGEQAAPENETNAQRKQRESTLGMNHRLDIDTLKEMYGDGPAAPWRYLDTGTHGLAGKEGLHPDIVADMFGFTSGRDLVSALLSAEKPADKIAGITDQRMLERHGELVDPASIQRAAEAAIHNEVRAKMMATGLKMFTKSPMSVTEINKAAKAAADTAIAAKLVGELRPAQYSAAETKANKALLKLAPKDPAGAAAAQREALLNNRLFKSASEAVEDVRKGLVYLKRFDKDSIRGKIDVDVRDQIDALLGRFDLRKNPSDAPTRQQLNLEKWIDSQVAAGYSPTVTPEMLDPTYRKPYREMSVEAFRGLIDTIKSMEHMGRERNALMINGEKHDLQEFVRNELVPKLQERGDRFSVDEIYSKPEDRGANPMAIALDHVGSWLRSLNAQLKPQEYKRNDFDRHELLGPFGKALFDPIFDANYNKVRMLQGLSDDFRVKAKELGRDWQKSLHDMLPNDKLIDAIATKEAGVPVYMKISRGKMVGMAIHVGNESNFDKLTKGYGWEPEQVWRFLHDNMTEKDWNAVQHVWDLYEKHWPEMQAMYRRLGQTTPDKIEPRAFFTPFGEMRGGYAAIKYDPLRSRRGEKDAAGEAINPADGLFGRDYFSRATTTNGSMNKRVEGYTDAIDLNFHTIERSLQESIHDLAYREALINANKIIEHPEFRAAFYKAYGREQYRAIQDWIGRIANANNSDRQVDAFSRIMQYARTGMVMNAIALRATTVLKHGGSAGIKTMGYFTGGGEKYLASRMAAMGSDYANQIASAKEKFGEINARLLQQDRDYRATASSLFEPESITSRAERFGHAAVAWSDMMTAVPTAWAAYDRAITEGIPKRQGGTGQPMTEAQAVAYANKVVREAHGSNVESARSNIMTERGEGFKMLTTLYGFMNNSYGQMADSINKVMTPGMGKPEVLARTFMAIIVPALWAGYLVEGAPKDDENWAVWAGKAITGEVAAMVPVVRDAYSMVQGYRHAGVIGIESWFQSVVQPMIDAYKIATGHEAHGWASHTADAVGMGLHIPGLGQLGKSAQYVADVESGKQHPEGTADYIKGMLLGAHHKK